MFYSHSHSVLNRGESFTMASLLQLASRPRLQLLVLMLVLLAGLFPGKTSADPPASPANGFPPPVGSSGNIAEGRAAIDTDTKVAAVKCYEAHCNSTDACFQSDFDKMGTTSCKDGYCASNLVKWEDGSSLAWRGCVPRKWGDCMKKIYGSCLARNTDPDEFKHLTEFGKIDECTGKKPKYTPNGKRATSGAIRICESELCNNDIRTSCDHKAVPVGEDRSSSGPGPTTGAKDLGWKVALMWLLSWLWLL